VKRIWKFTYAIPMRMPMGAKILCAQVQGYVDWDRGPITLWAECDESAPIEDRNVVLCGTGSTPPDVPEGAKGYIGTVQEGGFVWHLFDLGPGKAE
jgi:hypothetical protein